jgi:hypothetical protein
MWTKRAVFSLETERDRGLLGEAREICHRSASIELDDQDMRTSWVRESRQRGRSHRDGSYRSTHGEARNELTQPHDLRIVAVPEEPQRDVHQAAIHPSCSRQTRRAAQAFGQRGYFVEEWAVEIDGEEHTRQV